MTKKDAVADLSTLTTIPYNTLQKLFYRLGTVIAYDVQESATQKEQTTSIDIGIGTLNILVTEDDVSYKFIPNSALEQDIVNGVLFSNLSLVKEVEVALKNRVMNTYKDLL